MTRRGRRTLTTTTTVPEGHVTNCYLITTTDVTVDTEPAPGRPERGKNVRSGRRRLAMGATVLALLVAPCGSDSESDSASGDDATPTATAAPAQTATPADSAPADAAAPVSVGDTDLGEVLVDAGGFTLYGSTNDADGMPTCEGDCADAWSPATVDGDQLPAGLDPAVFSVVARPNGAFQLNAGDWPLYRFAGDITAGDTTGHGSGDVWFAAAPDGNLVAGEAQGAAGGGSSNDDAPNDVAPTEDGGGLDY